MTLEEKELEIAYKDGWAASAKWKKRSQCPFALEQFKERWLDGWIAEKLDRKRRRRQKKLGITGPRFVQYQEDGKWTRIDRTTGKAVGRRKKKYACPLGKA